MPPNERRPPKGAPSTSPTNPTAPDQRSHKDFNQVRELLDSLAGIEVDGGCDDCPAYQTIERVDVGDYVNRIFHDDTCPWWQRYQAATR
jgi:hypothetical protein